jgi:hypothetical protein
MHDSCRDDNKLGEGAIAIDAKHLPLGTIDLVAADANVANAATKNGLDRDAIARYQRAVAADGIDLAGEFMSENERIARRNQAAGSLHVGATQSGEPNVHANLVRPRFWNGHRAHGDGTPILDNGLHESHRTALSHKI